MTAKEENAKLEQEREQVCHPLQDEAHWCHQPAGPPRGAAACCPCKPDGIVHDQTYPCMRGLRCMTTLLHPKQVPPLCKQMDVQALNRASKLEYQCEHLKRALREADEKLGHPSEQKQ